MQYQGRRTVEQPPVYNGSVLTARRGEHFTSEPRQVLINRALFTRRAARGAGICSAIIVR